MFGNKDKDKDKKKQQQQHQQEKQHPKEGKKDPNVEATKVKDSVADTHASTDGSDQPQENPPVDSYVGEGTANVDSNDTPFEDGSNMKFEPVHEEGGPMSRVMDGAKVSNDPPPAPEGQGVRNDEVQFSGEAGPLYIGKDKLYKFNTCRAESDDIVQQNTGIADRDEAVSYYTKFVSSNNLQIVKDLDIYEEED